MIGAKADGTRMRRQHETRRDQMREEKRREVEIRDGEMMEEGVKMRQENE